MARINWSIIDTLCHIHRWSLRRLATELRFSVAYVSQVRSGQRRVQMEFADRIAEIFRLSYDRFLIHPSIKPESEIKLHPDIGITKQANGAPIQELCRDPEHVLALASQKEERQWEHAVGDELPKQTRKKMWVRRNFT